MRTIILTLDEAVKTQLDGAELLDSKDLIIFAYPEGGDLISLAVHNKLAELKCKTEFVKAPSLPGVKDDKTILLLFFACLIGGNENPFVIDSSNELSLLDFIKPVRRESIASVINSSACLTEEEKPKRTRKKKQANTEAVSEAVSEAVEEAEDSVVESPSKEEVLAENTQASDAEEPKAEEVKKPRKNRKQNSAAAIATIDDLKAYLKGLSSDDFDPSTMTMGIYESVRNSITKGTHIDSELKNTIIIDKKIEAINNAVGKNWQAIIDGVKVIAKL